MAKAIVVGAGIAGLTTAVGLHGSGWSVRVLEQHPTLRTSGTAVVLHDRAVKGLESLGLGPGLAVLAVPLTELRLRTYTSIPLGPARRGSSSVLIERAALAGLLREALPDPVLTFGCPLPARDLRRACAEADLVVGADGAHSTLRRELFGHRYGAIATGTTVWRGTAGTTTAGLTEYWGRRRRFGASERPGGGTNWYATAVLSPARRAVLQPDLEELRRLFGPWGGAVAATVASIDEGSILRHEIHRLARRLPGYHRGNAVLVGDAAHAMTPDLGRGANEAILDALSLVRNLEVHDGVDRALAGYDRSRRRATQLVATGSAAVDAIVHRRAPGAYATGK